MSLWFFIKFMISLRSIFAIGTWRWSWTNPSSLSAICAVTLKSWFSLLRVFASVFVFSWLISFLSYSSWYNNASYLFWTLSRCVADSFKFTANLMPVSWRTFRYIYYGFNIHSSFYSSAVISSWIFISDLRTKNFVKISFMIWSTIFKDTYLIYWISCSVWY